MKVSTKRHCVLSIFINFLLVVAVSTGLIEQCPQNTECRCLSVRMVNPTVVVKCRRVLIEEFPTMKKKVIAFYAVETRVKTLSRRSFVNATDLGMISVTDNPITCIEEGALSSLPNLEFLELVNVKLEDTSELRGLRTLINLKLSDNLLKNFTTGSLTDVPHLNALELDGNVISHFRFSHDKLQKLNLSRNQVQNVQKESFKNIRMLHTLDLSKNLIVHLQNIASQSLQSLNLAYNQIAEIDEAMWQDLPLLKSIDVSNNRIRDLSSVSELPFLESLNASNNLIERLDRIHGSETLVNLDVSKNRIRTLSDMADFPQLKSLCMAENAIEYFDGNGLQSSPLLSVLSLVGNRLTGFGSLSNNPCLVSLYLQENKIEHIQEGAFTHSASLEYIDVGSNNISDLEAFKNIPSLSYLNVSDNSIMELSTQSLQGCPKLSVLDMSKNLLEELPTFPLTFWPFQLYLDFNPIRVLDWNKLRNLRSLRRLSLNGTQITNIPSNSAFMPITHISIKNSNASIRIEENAFTYLVSIADLSIGKLAAVSPRIFASAHYLKKLELRSGDISEVTSEWRLTSLEYADLSHNRINRIDLASRSMTRLKVMILAHNLINNVSFVNHLSNIRELNLRHNRIRHVPKDAFVSCHMLSILDLSYNMIEEIIVGTFDTHQFLKKLYLSYNMLSNFSLAFDTSTDIGQVWKQVSILHLDGNRISTIDSMTFKSGDYSLKTINVAHNPLQYINETTFHGSVGLRQLDLSHTDLRNIPAGLLRFSRFLIHLSLNNVTCLKDLSSLSLSYPQTIQIERVELRDNHLTRVPDLNYNVVYELDVSRNNLSDDCCRNLGGTEDLTFLDVSTNNIEELKTDFIQSVTQLKHLNVSGNKLKRVEPNLFGGLLDLKMIDLTNNQLDGMPWKNMDNVKANVRINLTGNPILCDCSLKNYSTKLQQYLKLFGDSAPEGKVVCQHPLRLSGKYVAGMPLEQFQCKPESDPSKSAVSGMVGDTILLECPMRDPTGVTVTWLNVTEAHPGIRTSADSRLLIERMTGEDSGSYQCNATNQEGSEVLTVRLNVGLSSCFNGTTNQDTNHALNPGLVNRTDINELSRRKSVTISAHVPSNNDTFDSRPDEPQKAQRETSNSLSASSFSEQSQIISMELTIMCVIFNAMAVVTV